MEKKERKSLGKVNFLDGRSLKKMFDEKPGNSGILVGVTAKYVDGLNLAGAGTTIKENMIREVVFLGEVVDVKDDSVTIKQYRNPSFGEEMYEYYCHLFSNVTIILPSVEQFIAMANQIVFIEDREAYVDETHYAGVYCVIGHKRTKEDHSEEKGGISLKYTFEDELNAIFCKRDDAERMGDMLVSYGEIDGISYTGYEIREMLVL